MVHFYVIWKKQNRRSRTHFKLVHHIIHSNYSFLWWGTDRESSPIEIPRCYQQFFRYRYFAGIRFAGFSVLRSVLLDVNVGGNTFLSFRGNSFFEKFQGNSFFSSKGGWSVQRGGRCPPFLGKRGLPPIFWGAPAKFLIPKILTEFSFSVVLVIPEKYRPNTDQKYRIGTQL